MKYDPHLIIFSRSLSLLAFFFFIIILLLVEFYFQTGFDWMAYGYKAVNDIHRKCLLEKEFKLER